MALTICADCNECLYIVTNEVEQGPAEITTFKVRVQNVFYLQAVVVGGGYIGLECAAAMQLNGLDVTLVFPEDRFMARLFTPEIADFYEKFYADKGIKIIKEDVVTAFEGDGQVTQCSQPT